MNNRKQIRILVCPNCGEVLECSRDTWEKHYEQERRGWMDKAHKTFDALWKSGIVRRDFAYNWLARELKIPYADCHFSNFSIEQLKQVLGICELAKAKMLNAFYESNLGELGKDAPLADGEWGRNDFESTGVYRYTPED